MEKKDDDTPPPTMMMPQARQTNPNVGNDFTQPTSPWQSEPKPSTPWQSQPMSQSPPISPWQSAPMQQGQPMSPQMQTPNYMAPVYGSGGIDQNLPIAAVVCGSAAVLFSMCCGLFSLPLAIAAFITGFMGMNNANQDPQKYAGKNLAIGGMVLGGISILISFGLFLISLFLRQ